MMIASKKIKWKHRNKPCMRKCLKYMGFLFFPSSAFCDKQRANLQYFLRKTPKLLHSSEAKRIQWRLVSSKDLQQANSNLSFTVQWKWLWFKFVPNPIPIHATMTQIILLYVETIHLNPLSCKHYFDRGRQLELYFPQTPYKCATFLCDLLVSSNSVRENSPFGNYNLPRCPWFIPCGFSFINKLSSFLQKADLMSQKIYSRGTQGIIEKLNWSVKLSICFCSLFYLGSL